MEEEEPRNKKNRLLAKKRAKLNDRISNIQTLISNAYTLNAID